MKTSLKASREETIPVESFSFIGFEMLWALLNLFISRLSAVRKKLGLEA